MSVDGIRDKPFFKKLCPMVNSNPNSKEYCNYYKAYNHTTRNYINLKEFIEDLLDRDHCWEFVAEEAKKRKQGNTQEIAPMEKK